MQPAWASKGLKGPGLSTEGWWDNARRLHPSPCTDPWMNSSYLVGLRAGQPYLPWPSPGGTEFPQSCDWSHCFSSQPDPWNTHVWKGTNGTPTKRRAIGFKKLAE